MTAVGALAGLAQTGQALAVAGQGMKLATKKKKTTKDFVKTGLNTIVGTSFIRVQGSLISGL